MTPDPGTTYGGRNPHEGDDPHDLEAVSAGDPLENASAAVIMVHGRGATPESILAMHRELPEAGVAYLAPRAAGRTWYSHSFLEPVERNEPGRSSGLRVIERLLDRAASAGIPAERVLLLGFSQGGCLAAEYAARNPRRYGGVAVLSGGLIGEKLSDDYPGDMAGTPVFLGCSDNDPHIPAERVHETRDVFESLGSDVEERLYAGLGHAVNEDEMEYVREMVQALLE